MKINFDKSDILRDRSAANLNRLKEAKMIVIQSSECENTSTAYADLGFNKSKQAAHYVVDHNGVVKFAPFTTTLFPANTKFTSKAQKMLEKDYEPVSSIVDRTLSIFNFFNKNLEKDEESVTYKDIDKHEIRDNILIIEVCETGEARINYDKVSENLTRLLGYMIAHHGFTTENIWRIGDIVEKTTNPYQYYHIDDFHKLLKNAEKFSEDMSKDPAASPYCFKIDDHENSSGHCPSPGTDPEHGHSGHIHHWEPDTRNVNKLTIIPTDGPTLHDEDFTSKTINGSVFTQSNFQPDVNQEFVSMESNLYEPIYPDLTVPPRNATSLYNIGVESTKQIIEKLTAKEILEETKKAEILEQNEKANAEEELPVEDTETKTVMQIQEEEKRKPIIGKIPNLFDPYPVDDKIVQLQHHAPMVTLEFEEAQKVSSNLSFYVINRAINTEKRLVQLENIMSTQMRMLNRLSSRIKINCVYYGGQSVFDKYKCIRCLSDDLVNDAAQVTLDQCLNCSRYEPIEGQVYEIMDEDLKPGEANLFDDIQASYMTKHDYVELTRMEEMNVEDDCPKQDITSTNVRDLDDKDYDELLLEANNFVMNWERKAWDYQSPHINEYIYNFSEIGLDKENRLNPDNKYEDGWSEVAQFKYQRPDYGTNTLGDGNSSNGYNYGSVNTPQIFFGINDYEFDSDDLRLKILEYAKEACEYCEKSSAFQYTLGAKIIDKTKTPTQLVEMAIKGGEVSTGKTSTDTIPAVYTDCSDFTKYIYSIASGGKVQLPGDTGSLKDAGDAGTLFTVLGQGKTATEAIREAIPGDLILYRGVQGGHVTIYAGGDENYHASTDSTAPEKQVTKGKVSNRNDFYGILRHQSLSIPKLKNVQYVDVNITLSEYITKYQFNKQKNTLDGNDNTYLNPNNPEHVTRIRNYIDPHMQFTTDMLKLQFTVLTDPLPENYVTAEGIDKYFAKKKKTGQMPKGQSFIDAAKLSGVNPFFIIASLAIESGWCSSSWMNGGGKWTDPSNGKTLYNAYGLWCNNEPSPPKRLLAIQECSKRQWYTPEKAVAEGAEYFGNIYYGPDAVAKHGIRNTPYFMKWHMGTLIAGNAGTPGSMQYASDMRYAADRAAIMYGLMECMPGGVEEGMKHMRFLIPRFKTE